MNSLIYCAPKQVQNVCLEYALSTSDPYLCGLDMKVGQPPQVFSVLSQIQAFRIENQQEPQAEKGLVSLLTSRVRHGLWSFSLHVKTSKVILALL